MKKLIIFFVAVLLLSNLFCINIYADKRNSIKGHWAQSVISEEQFLEYKGFFNDNAAESLDLDAEILFGEYVILVYQLTESSEISDRASKEELYKEAIDYFKEKHIAYNNQNKYQSKISRKEAVLLIMNVINDSKTIETPKSSLEFTDIGKLSNQYKQAISRAFSLGIINGCSSKLFNPEQSVSRIQAMVMIERSKKEFSMHEKIPFKAIGSSKSYSSNKPSLVVEQKDDKITVVITRRFPTPGYTLEVKDIIKTQDGEYLIATTSKASGGDMQLQVITYISTTIEINKKYLDDHYKFILKPSEENVEKNTKSI